MKIHLSADEAKILQFVFDRQHQGAFYLEQGEIMNHFKESIPFIDSEDSIASLQNIGLLSKSESDRRFGIGITVEGKRQLALFNENTENIAEEASEAIRSRKQDRKHDIVLILISAVVSFLLDNIPQLIDLIFK